MATMYWSSFEKTLKNFPHVFTPKLALADSYSGKSSKSSTLYTMNGSSMFVSETCAADSLLAVLFLATLDDPVSG